MHFHFLPAGPEQLRLPMPSSRLLLREGGSTVCDSGRKDRVCKSVHVMIIFPLQVTLHCQCFVMLFFFFQFVSPKLVCCYLMLIAVDLLASLHLLHLFPLIKSEVFSCWERLIAHHCGGRVVQSEGSVFSNRLPRCADIDQSADYLHINGQESKEAPVGVSAR